MTVCRFSCRSDGPRKGRAVANSGIQWASVQVTEVTKTVPCPPLSPLGCPFKTDTFLNDFRGCPSCPPCPAIRGGTHRGAHMRTCARACAGAYAYMVCSGGAGGAGGAGILIDVNVIAINKGFRGHIGLSGGEKSIRTRRGTEGAWGGTP